MHMNRQSARLSNSDKAGLTIKKIDTFLLHASCISEAHDNSTTTLASNNDYLD